MTGKRSSPRSDIDWEAIRARVRTAGEKLVSTRQSQTAEVQTVLVQRAAALAIPPAATHSGHTLDVVTVLLARERYALESSFVVEVFRLGELARLPGARPPLFGLTAWRGDLLRVLDLRPVLHVAVDAPHDLGRVVVLGSDRAPVGLLVDAVQALHSVPASAVRQPPEGVAADREYVKGMIEETTLLLEPRVLLERYT